MLKDGERKKPFDNKIRRHPPFNHRQRTGVIAAAARAIRRALDMARPDPMTATERVSPRRHPPPSVSRPSISHSISAI